MLLFVVVVGGGGGGGGAFVCVVGTGTTAVVVGSIMDVTAFAVFVIAFVRAACVVTVTAVFVVVGWINSDATAPFVVVGTSVVAAIGV